MGFHLICHPRFFHDPRAKSVGWFKGCQPWSGLGWKPPFFSQLIYLQGHTLTYNTVQAGEIHCCDIMNTLTVKVYTPANLNPSYTECIEKKWHYFQTWIFLSNGYKHWKHSDFVKKCTANQLTKTGIFFCQFLRQGRSREDFTSVHLQDVRGEVWLFIGRMSIMRYKHTCC